MKRITTLNFSIQTIILVMVLFMIMHPYGVFSQNKVDSLTLLIEKEKNLDKKAALLLERSRFHPDRDYEKAEEDIDWAKKHYQQKLDKRGLADAHFRMAQLLGSRSKLDEAIYEDSIAIELAKTTRYLERESEAIGLMGLLYARNTNYIKAETFLDLALEIERDPVRKARVYNTRAVVQRNLGDFSGSLYSTNEGIRLLKEEKMDEYLLISLLLNKANTFAAVSNYKEAIATNLEGLKIKERLKDTIGMGHTYNNLASDFMAMGELDQAIGYYKKAIAFLSGKEFDDSIGLCYMNLGVAYHRKNSPDSAQMYHGKAIQFFEEIRDPKGLGSAYSHYSNFLIDQEDFAEARAMIDKSIEHNRLSDGKDQLGLALMDLGKLKLRTDDLDGAENALLEAQQVLEGGAHLNLRSVYSFLAQLYGRKGEFREAYRYSQLHRETTEKIAMEESRWELLKATNQYDLEKKDLEFALEQQKEKERQSRIILVAIASTLLLLALYIVLLSRRRRIKARHQAELTQLVQQHRIETARSLREAEEEERKRIANKLHDEVGALLSIAKLNVEQLDKELFVADSDAVNKIQTAEKLLGEVAESVRNISHTLMPVALEKYGFKSAIHDLVQSLQSSGKIKMEEVIEGFDDTDGWPKDFVLGTYRIVQEVLNNVIKHADASHVLVQLIELDDAVTIYIEDNGQGIAPENVQDGLGMRLLQSNVEYFNGTIEINGNPSEGTFVLVELKKGWL